MMNETLYKQSLQTLREIGNKTGEDVEEQLKLLSQLDDIYQEYIKWEKENPGQLNGGNEKINLVKNLCFFLMFESEYVPLKAKSAALSSTAQEIEEHQEKSKLPKVLVPIVKQIKFYISLLNQAKKEVERLNKELADQIEKAKPEEADLPLSDKERSEMKRKEIDMRAELKKWRKYIEKADDILTNFDNEVKAHQKEYNKKLKIGVGFVAAGVAVLTGGIATVVAAFSGAVAALGGAAVAPAIGGAAVSGLGVSLLGGSVFGFMKSSKRRELLNFECKDLKSQLECIKLEYERQVINLDKLTQKVNLAQDNKF